MKFAVLSLPRCGTAWAANWLTCNGTVCLHDPLFEYAPGEIPETVGAACTGLWLSGPPKCPYVLLDRPVVEINASCEKAGIPQLSDNLIKRFRAVPGQRFPWADLFDDPIPIWQILRPGEPFDRSRHEQLCKFNVQRDLSKLHLTASAIDCMRTYL